MTIKKNTSQPTAAYMLWSQVQITIGGVKAPFNVIDSKRLSQAAIQPGTELINLGNGWYASWTAFERMSVQELGLPEHTVINLIREHVEADRFWRRAGEFPR